MAHRTILTERQRSVLFDLPTDDALMMRHYILADDDIEHINDRRRSENRIGFALQLCTLRYPGRLLTSDEVIPEKVLRFIAAQLGLAGDDILPYAARRQTRQQHLHAIRQIYGFKMFSGQGARCLKAWLEKEAETARSNDDLARRSQLCTGASLAHLTAWMGTYPAHWRIQVEKSMTPRLKVSFCTEPEQTPFTHRCPVNGFGTLHTEIRDFTHQLAIIKMNYYLFSVSYKHPRNWKHESKH